MTDMSTTVRNALAELVACAEVSVPYTALNTAGYRWHDAMEAARAALAQSEAQPVAPITLVEVFGCYDAAQVPLQVRGVYQRDGFTTDIYVHMPSGASAPLAPPQQPQPVLDASWEQSTLRPQQAQAAAPAYVPMSESDVDDLARTMVKGNKSVNWLARHIESLVVARMRGDGK